MKDLVKGFIKWLMIVLTTLTLILWGLIFVAYCQDNHPAHKSTEDFEDTVGFRSVKITSKDDRLIFYTKELKNRIYIGSFGYDKYTRFDDFKLDGKYCVLYCKTHLFAYIVSPCKGG